MRHASFPLLSLSLSLFAAPVQAQQAPESDATYLLHRADILKDRVALAARERKLTKKTAARLRLAIGRVQTFVGNQQARIGAVGSKDADEMNQQLTDVERALPRQR